MEYNEVTIYKDYSFHSWEQEEYNNGTYVKVARFQSGNETLTLSVIAFISFEPKIVNNHTLLGKGVLIILNYFHIVNVIQVFSLFNKAITIMNK